MRMRFSAACISASVMRPRDTWRAMLRSMVARALSIGLLLDVVERDLVAGQRHHVGDAVAHLAGTDDADRLDGNLCAGFTLAGALQWSAGFLRLDACVHDALLLHQPRLHLCCRPVYLPAFSSSVFSSGNTWNRSATSP